MLDPRLKAQLVPLGNCKVEQDFFLPAVLTARPPARHPGLPVSLDVNLT